MSKVGTVLSTTARRVLGDELYLFVAYALITFRPGAGPPAHPQRASGEPTSAPDDWSDEEYHLYIDEARLNMAHQMADKHDIRARAQVILTTAIVLGGAIVASYAGAAAPCWWGKFVYALAALCTTAAGLAAGGIVSARSDIGTVNVSALTHYGPGKLLRAVAEGYASTRAVGAETVAVLVTVLRDCVLALVLGAGLLAVAHVWF